MAVPDTPSWLGPRPPDNAAQSREGPDEFVRLWRGFMTARVTLGLVLLLLQATLFAMAQSHDRLLVVVCAVYLTATLVTRLIAEPRRLGPTFDPRWVLTIGVDVVAFATLQFVQGNAGINYTPLLALPVLLASVLGSLPLALGTAAGATLLLLAQAVAASLDPQSDPTPLFAQTALTGAGYFVIAVLSSQLSARLASEEQRSRRSHIAVQVQRQVNALVIESLTDGVLVVDASCVVWAANPAAYDLLGHSGATLQTPFDLSADAQWQPLVRLTEHSFAADQPQRASVAFKPAASGPRHALVRTRMTTAGEGNTERLCVVFLQDQREMEARMRTEKLASMGRMSTAVAHEIRNPLAAIVQANALLDEDVSEPRLKRLIEMVQQNAKRLESIVDEVLDISRVQSRPDASEPSSVALNEAVERVCREWLQHGGRDGVLRMELSEANPAVSFDPEHLRRVLVNLLDNASRYASGKPNAIQVSTRLGPVGQAVLGVWSDGPPMEKSVERHLFEPFFSSESRSTGLGLYICRELCERHGAAIHFERTPKVAAAGPIPGNEFVVSFESMAQRVLFDGASDRMAATPWV